MPLIVATLQADLLSLFQDPPATHAECAQAWADAMESYAGAVIPATTTATAAAGTLSTALAGAFAAPPSAAAMELAFIAFGATLGGGMAPLYTAVPPAGPVGFADAFATNPATHAAAATAIASKIDIWMKTGTATLVAPPNTAGPWA